MNYFDYYFSTIYCPRFGILKGERRGYLLDSNTFFNDIISEMGLYLPKKKLFVVIQSSIGRYRTLVSARG